MKKLIALIFILLVCTFWYTNSQPSVVGLVPVGPQSEGKPAVDEQLPDLSVQSAQDERAAAVSATMDFGSTEVVTVRAKCVDFNGLPLRGIEFVATEIPGQPSALSADNGEVELVLLSREVRKLSPRTIFTFRSNRTIAAREKLRISPTFDTDCGVFRLASGGSVVGRVVDAGGQPVQGASVYCAKPVLDRFTEDYLVRRIHGAWPSSSVVTTGADGRYLIDDAPPSTYSVSAYASGTLRSISEPIEVRPGILATPADLVLKLAPREYRIEGVVLNEDNTPRVEASVELLPASGNVTLSTTRTDERGAFLLLAEPERDHTVAADRHSARPLFAWGVLAGTLDLVLQRKGHTEFLVTARTSDGSALDRFRATALGPNGEGGQEGRGESADGKPLTLLVPQGPFHVTVTSSGYKTFHSEPFDPVNPPKVVEAVLEPNPALRGLVLAGGAPVPGAHVEGYLFGDSKYAIRLACGLFQFERFQRPLATTANGQGRFSLNMDSWRNLDEDQSLHLRARGGKYTFGPELKVPAHTIAGHAGVVLQVARPGRMEGRLIATGENDIAGLFVSISRGDGEILTEAVDSFGAYCFEGLAPGRWQALALERRMPSSEASRHVGGILAEDIPWRFDVREGETTHFNLELQLPVQIRAELSGRFQVNGAPPLGWRWWILHGGERLANGPFDADGRFSIRCSVTRPVVLSIGMGFDESCGGASLAQALDLTEGKNEWSYNLTTANLLVTGLPEPLGDPDLQMQRAYQGIWQLDWKDEERGIGWTAGLLCARRGERNLSQVPAGTVTIVKRVSLQAVESSRQTVVLQPGESGLVRLGD